MGKRWENLYFDVRGERVLNRFPGYSCIRGEQGWRSGESTRLSPMRRHMWVEFGLSLLLVLVLAP